MDRVFCPNTGSICEAGYLEYKDTICVFYDEDGQFCALAENLKYSARQLRGQQPLLKDKLSIKDKTSLNRLLKDIGEPEQ